MLDLEKNTMSAQKKIALLIFAVLLAVCFVGVTLTIYQRSISQNVQDVSQIFLEEISKREISHLENNLDIQFGVLEMSDAMFRDFESLDIPSLQSYLGRMQDSHGFSFFALIDAEGNYCSKDAYQPATGRIDALNDLLTGSDRLISYHQSAVNDPILLGLPIEPLFVEGKQFVAIAASMDKDDFAHKMAFTSLLGQSRTSIITKEGLTVVYPGSKKEIQIRTNLLSILENQAEMSRGFTMEQMKTDMQMGQEGMSVYTMKGVKTFLYYAPVKDTNWYVISEMPYSLIHETVQDFMWLTAITGALIVAVVLILLTVFLLSVVRTQAAKRLTEEMRKTLKETDLAKQQAEEALRQMAFYDDLTGIANKNLFRQQAKNLLAESDRYAYVVLDLRKFKMVNELFGYTRGDLLLQHIAQVLQSATVQGEMIARFSADVFHLLLWYENQVQIEERLQKMAKEICQLPFTASSTYHVSVGFGLYVVENADDPLEQMGDKACLALKKIKDQHTSGVFFYNDDIRNSMIEEQETENDMQHGVDNREFIVYFQPKYSATSGQLAGAEALVRWNHPERGLIPPNVFIPVFEKNGFITTLDLYVLENVCKTIRQWLDEGRPVVTVSVNQSRLLLYSVGYINQLVSLLEKYNIPHELIELEVTESVFLEDSQRMVAIMRQLHDLDFSISMDDFGSGYSTLNMLQEILVDTLKIDKDFFSESANTERGRTIVSNIIAMAGDLNIKVVAEGVETAGQVAFLQQSGCDLLQGFYYSRPIPREDFEKMIPCNERRKKHV